ncbi:MAG: precorrin-6A synthase (deacetylating) [Aeromicrobium sp.]
MTRRVRLIGIGSGHPDQVTVEAARALNSVDYFIVSDKSNGTEDLIRLREEICRQHIEGDWRIVGVRDPERDRDATSTSEVADYEKAVTDWHEARAIAYEQALIDNPGDAGFLVWGDPAFYDSSVRIVERILARGNVEFEYDVIPGISSVQVLASRHKIVLHGIGEPLMVTTGRRLHEAVAAGLDNIVVMLNAGFAAADLVDRGDWNIWWGTNLGTKDEVLIAGSLDEVCEQIMAARVEVKESAGWVMDIYLLKRA